MRKLSTLAFAIGAIVSGQALAQAELKQVSASKAIPNQYIVVFKTPSVLNIQSADAVASYAEQASQKLVNSYNVDVSRKFAGSLNGVVVNASANQVQDLLNNPDVDYIEQDQIVSVSPLAATNVDQGNAIWGLDRVDQRSLPLNSNYHYDFDGAGVTAYVIDTGVLISHNEFGGRASHGYDFVDNDADATDCNGHGTHVAGTIGGSQYGVAKNVNIVGIKVLGCSGSGTNSGVIAGVDWVKNNASGPSVANMSLGGGVSQALDDAVNSAVAAGVTFVVAAGNDNSNACNYSPARAADAITVGSTTSSDSRSSFSNYGSCLDIYAPGSSIKSAWYNSNTSTNTISGTSMAAPHVAGVAALYLDEDSTRTPAQIDSLLSSRSSKNKVSDAKSGSPNELLYSLSGDGGPVDPVDPDPVLEDGVAVSISGANGSESFYTFEVPANTSAVTFNMSGGTGDADLYVQQGTKPTQSSYSCRPYKNGNEETCTFNNPAAGTWHVMVRGYSAYAGVSLVAQTSSGGGCGANCLDNGVPVTSLSGSRNSEVVYTIDVPAGVTLNVNTSGGSGDADLYVRKGAAPTTGTYDCRPYRNGNTESCSLSSGTGGTYYIMLRGYSAYSGLTLQASY